MKTRKISPFKKKESNRRRARKAWPPGSRSHPLPPADPPVELDDCEEKKEDEEN